MSVDAAPTSREAAVIIPIAGFGLNLIPPETSMPPAFDVTAEPTTVVGVVSDVVTVTAAGRPILN